MLAFLRTVGAGRLAQAIRDAGTTRLLDEYQTAFCDAPAGNIRLLAPAGSGKTHSLLHRCVTLAERNDGKAKFLVVTFTQAARDELRSRLATEPFVRHAAGIEITTLNSWGWRRVRDRHQAPKLLTVKDRNFAVQNQLQPVWKKHSKIADAMSSPGTATGKALLNMIDGLKNLGFDHLREKTEEAFTARVAELTEAGAVLMLDPIARELHDLGIIKQPEVGLIHKGFYKFWQQASQAMIDQSVFTFEDQKYVAWIDIRKQIEDGRLPIGGSRYTDVLVDEFQDVSPLDLALVRDVAALHRANVTIVGDDDQAIFEWRGATPSYILSPERWFDRPFATFILERNYRCPKNLVAHAKRLIEHNTVRQPKRVVAHSQVEARTDVIRRETFADSIDTVVGEIEAFLKTAGGTGAKVALVSRKRAQLIPYQVLLAQKDIPFCAAEDLQVFLSQAFESLLDLLAARAEADSRRMTGRVVDDTVKLCNRVKKYPLNKADTARLRAHLQAAKPRSTIEALDALSAYDGPLKGDNTGRSMSLAFATALRTLLTAATVSEAITELGDKFAGLSKDYGKAQEDIFFSDPPFFYLAQFAKRYGDDFERFVDDIQNAADTLAQLPAEDDAGGAVWTRQVHLMTALRAKGKEFDTVVLLDVNDGIWPTRHAQTPAQREGERRLFYVAMTRAKRRLAITVSAQIGGAPAIPSPFLSEAGLG